MDTVLATFQVTTCRCNDSNTIPAVTVHHQAISRVHVLPVQHRSKILYSFSKRVSSTTVPSVARLRGGL